MAKAGRKAKFTKQDYLDAVKKIRSINDKDVASVLGVHYTSVYRFRMANPSIEIESSKILEEIKQVRYDGDNHSLEVFRNNPSIKEWVNQQLKKRVAQTTCNDRTAGLYNVCKHLGKNPDALTIEECANLVHEARIAHENNADFIRGLAYHTIRKPLRIWFMLAKRISGEYLTNMGIDAGRSKGTGAMATERIPRDVRHRLNGEFGDNIKVAVHHYMSEKNNITPENVDDVIWEIKGIAHFMYYTATRITASSNVKLNNSKSKYLQNMWILNLIDKGKRGGIEWNKMLCDHGLERMREYVENRFNIPQNEQDYKVPVIDGYLFPWIHDNYRVETKIMKYALKISGLNTKIPNHIYRHTFAQDGLDATDGNYDLVADIGGWTDTGTLKLSYGKRSQKSKERGLMKMLGNKVEDVTYELRW